MAEMQRATSVDDLLGGFFGTLRGSTGFSRTDSEAAFQEFLKRIPSTTNLAAAASQLEGQAQAQAHAQALLQTAGNSGPQPTSGAPTFPAAQLTTSLPTDGLLPAGSSGLGSIPRVPSLDFLRQLINSSTSAQAPPLPPVAPLPTSSMGPGLISGMPPSMSLPAPSIPGNITASPPASVGMSLGSASLTLQAAQIKSEVLPLPMQLPATGPLPTLQPQSIEAAMSQLPKPLASLPGLQGVPPLAPPSLPPPSHPSMSSLPHFGSHPLMGLPPGLPPGLSPADLASLSAVGSNIQAALQAVPGFGAAAAAGNPLAAAALNPAAAAAAALQLGQLGQLGRLGGGGMGGGSQNGIMPEKETHEKVENRRARRMLSNRESARRSRKRKQEHLSKLETEVAVVEQEKQSIADQLQSLEDEVSSFAEENKRLREENERLKDELRFLRTEISERRDRNGVSPRCNPQPEPGPGDANN